MRIKRFLLLFIISCINFAHIISRVNVTSAVVTGHQSVITLVEIVIILIQCCIGPMHEEQILGNAPKIPLASFWFHFKSGNSLLEGQYFSTFQVLLEPCYQHGSDGVWNVEKYWFSLGGFPRLKWKWGLGCNRGVSQYFSLLHRVYSRNI